MTINLVSIETGIETTINPGTKTPATIYLDGKARDISVEVKTIDTVLLRFKDGRYEGSENLFLTGPNVNNMVELIFAKELGPSFLKWTSYKGRRRER
jgi:hypothetical protein